MTRTAVASRKQVKRPSAIPRFTSTSKVHKAKTLPVSNVVKATLQGRNHSKKPQTKSVRFAGLKDKSIKISPKAAKESSTGLPVNNSHIGDDFVFEADPDALASILNNDGVTREQLIKSQAAETAKKEQSADEFLLVDGRPSLCRRVPIKRGAGALPDARPSLLSTRVSMGPARVERPSVSGRTSFLKKGSVAPSFGRDSLYSFIEQKYSQRLQRANLEDTQRRTTIASAACQDFNHGSKLKDRTNKPENREPQRVLSTKKVAPTTPAARVLVAVNPVLGSPALRVRQSEKKTPVKSRLALAGSPEVKENVVTALDFQDDENVSPNVQSKISKKQNIQTQAKSRSRLQRPLPVPKKQVSGSKPLDSVAIKSKLPPRNSDRYSFMRKPAPSKVAKDTKLHVRFSPINLKNGEEMVEPRTLNEGKPVVCEFKSKPEEERHDEVCSPAVLNSDQSNVKSMGTDQLVLTSRDTNHNIVGLPRVSNASKNKLKSPRCSRVPASRLPSKKVIDADAMLEMLKQRIKTIKRRSVQTEFCSVITSMEKEMALASVAEEPNDTDGIAKPNDKVEVSSPTTEKAAQVKSGDSSSLRDVEETSWHNILKSDKSPTWKAILEKEAQTGKANAIPKLSDDSSTNKNNSKPPTWKDVLKQDEVSTPSVQPSAKSSTLMPMASMENLRRLLGSEAKRNPLPESTFKGGAHNTGVGLGITREKFLNILSYNPSPSVKCDPVSARNKFFQPVPGDETSDSSNLMIAKEMNNDRAVFENLKLESGKFFPDSRLGVQGSCESDRLISVESLPKYLSNKENPSPSSTLTSNIEPKTDHKGRAVDEDGVGVEDLSSTVENINPSNTAQCPKAACIPEPHRDWVKEKSMGQAVPQEVGNEQLEASPVAVTGASNSVQWVEKTPGVSRYETNRARIVDPSQSPESPDFDSTKSLFWVEKTPASRTFKVAHEDLSSIAESARQAVGQAGKPGIIYTENEADADCHLNITDKPDSTILHTKDLHEPSVKSPSVGSDERVVSQCHENNQLSYSHTKHSPATPSEPQYDAQERHDCYGDARLKNFSGATWSKKYGSSQHKISSGRLGKDTKREECDLANENIPIVRVFSPKAASPHASTTSPSMNNLTNSRKLHQKRDSSFNDHEAASRSTILSHKHVSPATRNNSPTNRRKVKFSDIVTCINSDEAVGGSLMPLPSINAKSQSPCDGYLELKQPRGGCEATPEKPAMHKEENLKDYNPTDLDLSFLDSLHVVAIETKNDSMARVSMLPRPQHPIAHSQEEAPSAVSVTWMSHTLSPLTTQSVPNVTTAKTAAAIQDNLQLVTSTLPCSVSRESSVYFESTDLRVNKAESGSIMKEKSSVTHKLSSEPTTSAMPRTLSSPAKTLQMCLTSNPLYCTEIDDSNIQDATGISRTSRTQDDQNTVMPSNFLMETGGVYSFASQENDANAEKSPSTLHSRMLPREDAPSPSQVSHIPQIASPFTGTKADHVPCLKAGDSATAKKESTKHAVQSNLDPISSALPAYDPGKDIITSVKGPSHSLIGSHQSHSAVSITYPVLPNSKCGSPKLSRGGLKESSYPSSLPSACGNNAIKSAIPRPLKLTPLKPQSLLADGKDSSANSAGIGFKSAIPIAAPKPIFPPAPQTPAAFRQLRRKLQESPVPKTFRSRCSPLKSSAFGVRKTPQKRVRFMSSSSPYMKSLCSKRFAEALLDEEVALLTCRRFRSPGTPSKKRRSRVTQNPLGRVLLDGDDSHFVPISPMDRNKKPSAATGSAFSVFKQ